MFVFMFVLCLCSLSYVNDIHAAYSDATWLASFKARLGTIFKIKDLGDLSQLLCTHITRDMSPRTISVDHSKYMHDIMAKPSMTDFKPLSLTMNPGVLSGLAHMDSLLLTWVSKDGYPILLGSPQYAAVCTRPDVSTAFGILGPAQAHPTVAHLQPMKKVLRYITALSTCA
jgi:hypothetical protein